jgi:prevent-host-death family protein
MEVGVRQAKIDLSKLIKSVLQGEKVVITSHGKPLVELVPAPRKGGSANRGYGSLKDVLYLPPGWDSPEAEEEFLNQFDFIREQRASESVK